MDSIHEKAKLPSWEAYLNDDQKFCSIIKMDLLKFERDVLEATVVFRCFRSFKVLMLSSSGGLQEKIQIKKHK